MGPRRWQKKRRPSHRRNYVDKKEQRHQIFAGNLNLFCILSCITVYFNINFIYSFCPNAWNFSIGPEFRSSRLWDRIVFDQYTWYSKLLTLIELEARRARRLLVVPTNDTKAILKSRKGLPIGEVLVIYTNQQVLPWYKSYRYRLRII